MGRVALEISKRIIPNISALWLHLRLKDIEEKFKTKLIFENKIKEELPLEIISTSKPQIKSGVLFTNDFEQATQVITLLIVGKEAIEKFNWHQQQGHRIIIVSASPELWIKPWCQKKNVEFIATKLATEKQLFTGEFLTPNCYGKEKLRRILLHIPQLLNQYSEIYVYGDSQGDKELLSLATHPFYRTF
jgi:HAD superfamily phosphoserine phosphatase-like hydrolase